MLVEITLVRVEITAVSVVVTFVRVNHNACENYFLSVGITLKRIVITLVSVIFTRIRVKITLVCVETTLCVWKSYYACKNQSCAC
jgi:hypothetical protein